MSAKLTRRLAGDVTVLDVSGRLTLGEGSTVLREEVKELATAGTKKVLINMSDVSYMDSSGIGELVSGSTTIASAGGALKLLNVGKRVQEMLRMTRLHTVFESFDDEAAALRSFS